MISRTQPSNTPFSISVRSSSFITPCYYVLLVSSDTDYWYIVVQSSVCVKRENKHTAGTPDVPLPCRTLECPSVSRVGLVSAKGHRRVRIGQVGVAASITTALVTCFSSG